MLVLSSMQNEGRSFWIRIIYCTHSVKIHFPEVRDIGISYCHLLLHDTMLMEDAHRTGLSDTPVCECGRDRATADHFLIVCSRYEEERNV